MTEIPTADIINLYGSMHAKTSETARMAVENESKILHHAGSDREGQL
jgi:hypothetical protein